MFYLYSFVNLHRDNCKTGANFLKDHLLIYKTLKNNDLHSKNNVWYGNGGKESPVFCQIDGKPAGAKEGLLDWAIAADNA